MAKVGTEHVVALIVAIIFLSPVYAFFYGYKWARGCRRWPGRWRVMIALFYAGYLIVLPYLYSRRNVFFARLPAWELLAGLFIPVAGLLAPVFATSFILNAIDIGEADRVRRNLCRHCKYDLTGNVSDICPECGEEIEPRDQAESS